MTLDAVPASADLIQTKGTKKPCPDDHRLAAASLRAQCTTRSTACLLIKKNLATFCDQYLYLSTFH